MRRFVSFSALATVLPLTLLCAAAHAQTYTVTAGSTQGFSAPASDNYGGGTVTFTNTQARSGTGSLRLTTPDNNGKATYQLGGTASFGKLSALTDLGYSYYKSATSTSSVAAPALKLLIFNPDTLSTGILVYEPADNIGLGGSTASGVWTDSGNIVATDGNFWLRNKSQSFYGPNGIGVGLSNYVGGTTFTQSGVTSSPFNNNSYIYGFQLGVGSFNGTFDGNVDDFHFSFNNGPAQLYNFEAAPAITATPEPGAVVSTLSLVGMTGLGLVRGRMRTRRSKTAA